MTIHARVSESVSSLPNTHYMTAIGVLLFLVAFAVQSLKLGVEAALIASTGVFFIVLGLLSYGILWFLGWIETT